ncbi:MAG: flagellar hook capping FlgD N-terminal domain-containing protein [Rhodospirillales bacterium]|tara:strand:+ start:16457 stop:17023 length:567 start_codon:yes stop_codon:yes gene_type:complete
MTTVSPVTNTATGIATGPTEQPQIGEEFNSFLKLLTAQLRNQDPLAPLDSTQFVEQLATFSSLEQNVKSNSSLDVIAAKMSDLYAIVSSQWLGNTVTVESTWVPFSDEAVKFAVEIPDAADRAVLTVKDDTGKVVWNEALDKDATSFSWDGSILTSEDKAPEGLYQMGIDLYRGEEYAGTMAPKLDLD